MNPHDPPIQLMPWNICLLTETFIVMYFKDKSTADFWLDALSELDSLKRQLKGPRPRFPRPVKLVPVAVGK